MKKELTAEQEWQPYIRQKYKELDFWRRAIKDVRTAHTAELKAALRHYERMFDKVYCTICWAEHKLSWEKRKEQKASKRCAK